MKNRRIIITIFFVFLSISLYSQEYNVSGVVKCNKGEPVFFATIHQKDGNRYTMTDEEGFFKIKLPKGKSVLIVSCLGYAQEEVYVNIDKNLEGLDIVIKQQTLGLNEVIVTATAIESKSGTGVYEIGEQAIKQVQAMNLSDVLKLLPGKKFTPSDMNSTLQADIRTAASSSANNYGTSVILDGAQISNDANMQAINPSFSLDGGKAVVGKGIDLRTITTSNIEKVEVISGVPSPKYGDITSGAILVQSKTGKSPLFISANINPTTYQISASKGLQLGDRLGFLNTDISYTYANASPIDNKNYYNSVNVGVRWRTTLNKKREWNNTVSYQLNTSNNGQRFDPDKIYEMIEDVNSQRNMLSINGNLKLLGTTSYTLSGTIQNQHSYFKTLKTDGPFPMTDGLEAGTFFTTYSPLTYEQTTEIKGLPVSLNGRLETDQHVDRDGYRFSFNSGVQYSYNKNYGKGRVVGGNVVGTQGSLASRSAKFHEIPASQAVSAYHESKIIKITEKMRHELRLGLRYDYMNTRYNLLSPRLSFNSLLYNKFKIRASWGISYKAPAMIQLYPGPSYYDFTNLSYYATNPKERLAIVTTYIHQPNNLHLKPSKGDMKEIGLDWQGDNLKVRVTYYHRVLSNGIYNSPELIVLKRQLYDIKYKPVNKQPIVSPIEGGYDKILKTVYNSTNSYTATTDGVEIVITPPKIEATNTQLDMRFAYIETLEDDHSFRLNLPSYTVEESSMRYGVYERPPNLSKLSSGNLSIIQHIPSLRLVFNFMIELNFLNYSIRKGESLYPYAYYDSDGDLHDIPDSQRESSDFEHFKLPEHTYTKSSHAPFYTNSHLQVRKETRNGHSFSFFANNFLWHNPTYYYKEVRHKLNNKISFGFALSLKISN